MIPDRPDPATGKMQTFNYPSASHQLEKTNQIRFNSDGQGNPVLLFHGIAASNLDWEFLSPLLVKHGFRTIRPDLPGHGESIKPKDPPSFTFDWLYQTVRGWIEELHLDQELILIGHSLGGLISLRLANDLPDKVDRLVLIDPFFHHQQLSPFLRFVNRRPELCGKALDAAPPWLIHAIITMDINNLLAFDRKTRRQIATDYKRASPYIPHLVRTVPEPGFDPGRITQPTLVIWGDKDLSLAPETFSRLIAMLPNARGYPVIGAGHQPHLSHPSKVNHVILNFLLNNPA